MTEQKITTDFIMATIKEWVEKGIPIGPEVWLNAASKLNVLIGEEHTTLFEFQQNVAQAKMLAIEGGDSVSKAKTLVESSDIYKKYCIQKAKIEQIQETIRIAKYQARLSSEEYKNQK